MESRDIFDYLNDGYQLSDELKKELEARTEMTTQQINSKVLGMFIEFLMDEDETAIVKECQRQITHWGELSMQAENKYYESQSRVHKAQQIENQRIAEAQAAAGNLILQIQEAEKKYGKIDDENAKQALSFFAALLKMGIGAGADPNIAVRGASFPVYALLGGQASTKNIWIDK